MKRIINVTAILLIVALTTALAESKTVQMNLEKVKVYFQGAEMHHTAKVKLDKGLNNLLLENISENPDESSLKLLTGKELQVLYISQKIKKKWEKDYTSEIENLKKKAEKVKNEIQNLNNNEKALATELKLLNSNTDLKSDKGITVAQLKEMATYFRSRVGEINNELSQINNDKARLNDTLFKHDEYLGELMDKFRYSSNKQIEVAIKAQASGTYELELNYFDPNARWYHEYDLRLEDLKSKPEISYKAKVWQNTGLDWEDVNITFSTGQPNTQLTMNKVMPLFAYLNYYPMNYAFATEDVQVKTGSYSGNGNTFKTFNVRGSRASDTKIRVDGLDVGNQSAEFNSRDKALKSENIGKSFMAISANSDRTYLNTEYTPESKYTIPSDSKYRSIVMKRRDAEAEYEYYATPRLNDDVYLLSKFKEGQGLNLFPGNANVYFEDAFSGTTYINPYGTDSVLYLPIAIDKSVSVKKEKVKDYSDGDFFGSKVEKSHAYDIVMKNGKDVDIKIVIKDQIPLTTDDDIEIELLEKSGAKYEKKTGIVTWELTLKPRETVTKRFSYKITQPEDKIVDLRN